MNKSLFIESLADIKSLLKTLPTLNQQNLTLCQTREPQLTKPAGSLGRLEEITAWLCAWQKAYPPQLQKIEVRVFAGNHGVVQQGVSAFPASVTAQMVKNFKHNGAAINQICQTFGAHLQVIAFNLEQPTQDFTEAPALSESDFIMAFNTGLEAVPNDTDLLVIGEMGIGNTTSAAAICTALFGGEASFWTGAGTGVQGETLTHKAWVVAQACSYHQGLEPLEILRCLGGYELAAMAGSIIGARIKQIPVLLDGYVCTAAAACLAKACKQSLDHCLVGHKSHEAGHVHLLEQLDKKALLDLNMRLGEASGAALAIGLLKAAINCHNNMTTFAEAGVSDK